MIGSASSDFHREHGAHFTHVNGVEAVDHYGDVSAEYAALRRSVGVLDLSYRSRVCVLGSDRQRFLNGQVTNNVKDLKTGEGCYAALVNSKGRMESDLNIHGLQDEILLDFEPGLTERVKTRLEKFIIAEDVEVVDVTQAYGLLSVQGPKAALILRSIDLGLDVPSRPFQHRTCDVLQVGEVYLMNRPRVGSTGYDLYVPASGLATIADRLIPAARNEDGRACGWAALEIARIEDGRPRYGQDMDESNLAPECGIEHEAISYTKGCYIGQEVIARIRTYGQVAKALRGLRLSNELKDLPAKGTKLFVEGRQAGYTTSAVRSPSLDQNIALGYVRKEVNQLGSKLVLRTTEGDSEVEVVALPFTERSC